MLAHDLPGADEPVQDGFIQNDPQRRRARPAEDRLPFQAGGDQLFQLIAARFRVGGQDRPRVIGGLKQAGYEEWLPGTQGRRPPLELDPFCEP